MFDDCLYHNLSSLTKAVTQIWKDEFAPLGLSPSHGYLLFAMVEKPREQQKDYGDYLDLEASTVNRLLDTLINKGLIEKSGSGRGSSVFVTQEGKKVYRQVSQSMNKLKVLMNESLGDARFYNLVEDLSVAKQSLNPSQFDS